MTANKRHPLLPLLSVVSVSLGLLLVSCNSGTVECPQVPEMVQTDEATSRLQQQWQQQQLELDKLQAALNVSAQQLQQAQQQLAEKSQQVDALTQDKQAGQVAAQNTAITSLEQQLAQQQQEIERLQAELDNKPQ